MLKKTLIASIVLAVASTSALAKELTTAKFLFDVGPYGNHSWVLKGIKDRTFEKYGINLVPIGVGPGSVKTGMALAAGKADVGYQDFSGVITVNGKYKTPGLKAIFVVDDRAQDGVYALKSSGIKTWDDLDGRTVGSFPTGTTRNLIPVITTAKPSYVNMPFALRVPSLVSGKVDASEGFLTTMKFNLIKSGHPDFITLQVADKLPYAISRVITVSNAWAAANPEAVDKLRKAVKELLVEHIDDPEASVRALKGPLTMGAKGMSIEIERAKFNNAVLIMTDRVKKHGLNNSSVLAPRLDKYIDVLSEKLRLPNKHAYYEYYDLD